MAVSTRFALARARLQFRAYRREKKALREIGGAIGKPSSDHITIKGFSSHEFVAPEASDCFNHSIAAVNAIDPDSRSISTYGAQRLYPTDKGSAPAAGLSFLRALAVAEEIARGLATKEFPPPATVTDDIVKGIVKHRFDIQAYGTSIANKTCLKYKDNARDQCMAKDQKVELESTLEGYMFTIEECGAEFNRHLP
ncbi:MAG: hypothetical protein ABJE95_29045 [Byssovorax sp.]